MRAHERVYGTLLLLYPRAHRREYGEPMTQLLRDRLRDEGGGARSAIIWGDVVLDLVGTALTERKVTSMDTLKAGWWRISAGLIAFGIAFLGIGNMFADDPGPFTGKVLAAALAVTAAGVIIIGLRLRERRRALGSTLVGIGTLPGSVLIIVFWFPPVALLGVLSLFTSLRAFGDGVRARAAAAAATP